MDHESQLGELLVIGGPTASGKTAAAFSLSERLPIEVISADSVQVYRGFDIGSAKPTVEEREKLPHHLVDILEPEESIDAAEYARLADRAIADVRARGRYPVVVGGTGLWIRALLRGLVEVPRVDHDLRAELEAFYDRVGSAAAHRRLEEVDPISAASIHANDRLRVVRALEVFEQTGTPLGALREEHALGSPRYDALVVALEPDFATLTARIEDRLDAMLAAGWVDEVRGLLAKHSPSARAFGSVGYRQIVGFLSGDCSEEEMRRRARKATRVYARRQRTWFRGDSSVTHRLAVANVSDGELFRAIQAHLEA